MPINETIRAILQQKAAVQEQQMKAEEMKRAEQARIEREETNRRARENAERIEKIIADTNSIIKESHVLEILRSVDPKNLPGSHRKSQIAIYYATQDNTESRITLLWGNHFSVNKDGTIGYEPKFSLFSSETYHPSDYRAISIYMHPQSKNLRIFGASGDDLPYETWKYQPDTLIFSIAQAIAEPEYFRGRETNDDRRSDDTWENRNPWSEPWAGSP